MNSSYPGVITDLVLFLLGIINTLLLLSLRRQDKEELNKIEPLKVEVQDLVSRVEHLEHILGTPEDFQELRSLLHQVSQALNERQDKMEAWMEIEGEHVRALMGSLKVQQEAFYELSAIIKELRREKDDPPK